MSLNPIIFSKNDIAREQASDRRLPNQDYQKNYYRLVEAFQKGYRNLSFQDKKNAEIWSSILRRNGLKASMRSGFGPIFGGDGTPVDNYEVYVGGFESGSRTKVNASVSPTRSGSIEQLVDKTKMEVYSEGKKAVSFIERKIQEAKDQEKAEKEKAKIQKALGRIPRS
jgi:hypothetical protein